MDDDDNGSFAFRALANPFLVFLPQSFHLTFWIGLAFVDIAVLEITGKQWCVDIKM